MLSRNPYEPSLAPSKPRRKLLDYIVFCAVMASVSIAVVAGASLRDRISPRIPPWVAVGLRDLIDWVGLQWLI